MSRIVKNHRVILDDKTFSLAPDIIPSISIEEELDEINKKTKNLSDEIDVYKKEEKMRADMERLLEEAASEAKMIEQKAQEEAEFILNDAYENAKGIYEKAKDDGYQDGYAHALEEAKEEADAVVEQALQIKYEVENQYKQMLLNAENEMINLVLETTKLILDNRIQDDISIIETAIQKGILSCVTKSSVVLRVSAEDYEYAVSIKDSILALSENVDELEIKADHVLSKGGCVIEAGSGSVDSGIYTQYDKVKDVFLQLLNEG